mgnify:FL=1|tara:strand:- start:506 stop:1132 length:627 start_codon:yes stop_codon:yes gene_type:complete
MNIEDTDVEIFIALCFLSTVDDTERINNIITTDFRRVVKFGLHLFGYDEIRRIISDNGDDVETVQSCVVTEIANLATCGVADAEYAYAELIYQGVYDGAGDKDDAEFFFERALRFWRSARDKNHKLAINRCKLWVDAGRWRCQRPQCGQIFRRCPSSIGFCCSRDCHEMYKLDKVVDDVLAARKMRRRFRNNHAVTPDGMRIPCFRSN